MSDPQAPREKPSPAFQFYCKDFLSSTKVRRMSNSEVGIYIKLLATCWLDNGLPDDVAVLAQLAGVKQAQFARLWAGVLHECFYEKHGRLFNERLDKERHAQAEYRRKQKANAEKRWESRGNATAMPPHSQGRQSHRNALQSAICDLQSASTEKKKEHGPLDLAFSAFQEAYPQARRKGGWMVQTAFIDQVEKAGSAAVLMDALANHKASEQWQQPKLIPNMDKWLSEERWRQRLDPPKPVAVSIGSWVPPEVRAGLAK